MNKIKQIFQNNRLLCLIIIILIPVIVLLIILSIKRLENGDGKDYVDIQISFRPENTNIYLDGQRVANNSTIKVSIGEHNIRATLDNYEEYNKTVNVSQHSKTIYDILTPLNTDDLSGYYEQYHSFLSQQIQLEYDEIVKLYPVANYLPFNNNLPFDYDYNVSDDYLTFTIVVTPEYKINYGDLNTIYSTLSRIDGGRGRYDLSQYNIEILEYTNPFINSFEPTNSTDPLEFLKNGYSKHENFTNMQFRTGKQQYEYYYTVINNCNPEQPVVCDRYKVLLQQTDSGWKLLGQPESILTKYNTDSSVPQYILYDANNYLL